MAQTNENAGDHVGSAVGGRSSPTPPAAVLPAGIHDGVPMLDYVHDRISPEPSLSTGVVEALVSRSPLHGWQSHPRLGGGKDDPSARGDIGSAVHALVLGGQPIVFVDADDWRTKDAKAERDEARAAGVLPLLAKLRTPIERAAESAKRALLTFGAGRCEQTMLWQDEGVWCRGRADYLTTDGKYDIDLKTCESADPYGWIRGTLVQGAYDVQAALRARGHHILTGVNRDVLFLLVEIVEPYAVSFVGVGPALMDLGNRKIERAIKAWSTCMRSGKWPAYPIDQIAWAEPPGWAEYGFEERQISNKGAA